MSSLRSKLCEDTKNYKYAYPGSNKVVYGACEQESEEKIKIDIFVYAKLDFCKKKLLVKEYQRSGPKNGSCFVYNSVNIFKF